MDKALWKIIFFLFCLLFFIVPIIFFPGTSELFEFNKIISVYIFTTVIVTVWIVRSLVTRKVIFRSTFLDIPLLLFLASQIASTFTSVDIRTSIFGYYGRFNGGLVSLIAYSLLYWAYVSNLGKSQTLKIIKVLLFPTLVVIPWAILEHFGASPSCSLIAFIQSGNIKEIFNNFSTDCWFQDVQARVFATIGQPNWLAAWVVTIIPITWAQAITQKLTVKKMCWFTLSILLFCVLLFTKSRSGILGFIIASLIFWIFTGVFWLKTRSKMADFLTYFLTLNLSFLVIAFLVGTPWLSNIPQLITESKVESGNTPNNLYELDTPQLGGTESGEIRKIVWKGAIAAWKNYPILGTGPETFAFAYYKFRPPEHNLTSEWDYLYNKAHNEYLNYLATTGIVGLTAYLTVAAFMIYQILKLKSQNSNLKAISKNLETENVKISDLGCGFEFSVLSFALLSGYVSILVTNFFGFSVTPISLMFFLFPAMANSLNEAPQAHARGIFSPRFVESGIPPKRNILRFIHKLVPVIFAKGDKGNEVHPFKKHLTRFQKLTICLVLIASCYLLFTISRYWLADYFYNAGKLENKSGNFQKAKKYLESAISLSPDEPIFWGEISESSSGLAMASYDNPSTYLDFERQAFSQIHKANQLSNMNLSLKLDKANLFIRHSAVNPDYLNQAKTALIEASRLAPTNAKVSYNLALAYLRTNEKQKAIEELEKTIALKSNYKEPHFALGVIFNNDGDIESAKKEFNYILNYIDPFDEKVARELAEITK